MNNKTPTERANELYHHGIKGQKWGVRRFQNSDGSLTADGKKRYNIVDGVKAVTNALKPKGEIRNKTEWEKRFEDDHGINPHRPNGTKTSNPTPPILSILDPIYNKKIKDMEAKKPAWKKLVEAIIDSGKTNPRM